MSNKIVVLGVTGSIAAYKAVDVASQLTQKGIDVEVILTKAATQFVTPLTFRSITARPVVTDMFQLASPFSIEHVALAEAADLIAIAPATANIIAKLANGIADDSLTCTVLATAAPVVIAPAMHTGMYNNPVTQLNLTKLHQRGFTLIGPLHGRLASGGIGLGRFAPPDEIVTTICHLLDRKKDLIGKEVIITAGGTQEAIDPVRYIGNRSSGKMGYALAAAARDRGAHVRLISAPTSLAKPLGIEVIDVQTAEEMSVAVGEMISRVDILIMAAAVADYRPVKMQKEKVKKADQRWDLTLERTPDILAETASCTPRPLRIGFAAETENLLHNAKVKLDQKDLDLIIANDITIAGSGFGADQNQVVIIDRTGCIEELPLLNKTDVAQRILDRVVKLLAE
ncbi:bifunctional phosphopantothenoylcysteine decarboxylase/phosphopantothenate--cysteine ligase CoaBC [Candidatus Acetothermia bacterium]|jgi:phosphopantothenoylcysteine decarboxylase/phosphopantothenate--cysteine ligase|nr:bifunctional phosphopantothenoylcysteine decarboxylase/phosphopantothenate--cysteine ligase CoaBC [Candidatus Acetothermia bacterium]MCI2427182.1 bifunctional phosphopantothenoylcysteine decarboxylase/phosphopantothenate--cysteine ligase CoaBC [Candidatus Acetothermia bacterium]MCI2428058.1 bifunctional phosphopantothenoylcysteine decarboxylase/phosphopantothenate--cysteine ligase CoaBC [Candidatus Acetothermia bacterium]